MEVAGVLVMIETRSRHAWVIGAAEKHVYVFLSGQDRDLTPSPVLYACVVLGPAVPTQGWSCQRPFPAGLSVQICITSMS